MEKLLDYQQSNPDRRSPFKLPSPLRVGKAAVNIVSKESLKTLTHSNIEKANVPV